MQESVSERAIRQRFNLEGTIHGCFGREDESAHL